MGLKFSPTEMAEKSLQLTKIMYKDPLFCSHESQPGQICVKEIIFCGTEGHDHNMHKLT